MDGMGQTSEGQSGERWWQVRRCGRDGVWEAVEERQEGGWGPGGGDAPAVMVQSDGRRPGGQTSCPRQGQSG